MSDPLIRFVTRRQLVTLINEETGIPISYSRLMKDGAAGRGPRPVATFGKRLLYTEEDGIAYARSLVQPLPKGETPSDTPLSVSGAARSGGRRTARRNPQSRGQRRKRAADQADDAPVSP